MVISDSQHKIHAGLRNKLLRGLLVALCVVFTSCDDVVDRTTGKSQVRVDVDWSGYGKSVPTGMTIMFHHNETGERTQTIDNNISYVTPYLSPGRHWATAFNLTEEEFGNIRFRGLEAAETAEAYVREYTGSKWYTNLAADGSYVAGQPEWLAVDTIMTPVVEPLSDGIRSEAKVIGTLRPRNIIHTLHVVVHIENIGNLLAARGAIGGLAAGRRLAGDCPNDNAVTVTHLIESDCWTCSRTSSSPDVGLVKADIRCFGLPANHKGTPGENRLEFQALLADGRTVKRYDIPVGHLIERAAVAPDCRGDDLDLYLEVWLDSALPPCSGGGNGSGGVDVWFDDWDDYIDFNIPM